MARLGKFIVGNVHEEKSGGMNRQRVFSKCNAKFILFYFILFFSSVEV
jgi:hypothetical protein